MECAIRNGLLLAQGAAPGASSPWFGWLPLVFLVVIVYFLMIRPMQQREKRHRAFLAALKAGDKVVTQGGLQGTVVSVGERTIQLRIADGVKVDVARSAVMGNVPPEEEGR